MYIFTVDLTHGDVALHAQYISLALSLPGIDSQVLDAREMATNHVAVGEEGTRISEISELYERAEGDYICVCIVVAAPQKDERVQR